MIEKHVPFLAVDIPNASPVIVSTWYTLCQPDTLMHSLLLLWDSAYGGDGSDGQGLIWHEAWLLRVNPSECLK